MENQSGLKPLGRAVLVKMQEAEKKGGLIKIPEHVRENSSVMEQRAEVVAIGATCWSDEAEPRCAVGAKVFVTKLSGFVVRGPADGKLYRVVNDRDVFLEITEEREVVNG